MLIRARGKQHAIVWGKACHRSRAALGGGSKVIILLANCKNLPPNDSLRELGCLKKQMGRVGWSFEGNKQCGGKYILTVQNISFKTRGSDFPGSRALATSGLGWKL